MNQTEVKGLIFDCDGTILNSMPAWHSMEKELARRAGIPLTPALQEELNANTLNQTVSFFHEVGGLGSSYEDLYKETLSILTRFYVSSTLKPGVASFLREAAKRDIPMVVASSSPSSIIEIGLKSTGLFQFFKAIVSASDMNTSKRNPEVIEKAYLLLGIEEESPSECCEKEKSCCENKGLYRGKEGLFSIKHESEIKHEIKPVSNSKRKGVWGVEDSVYSIKVFSNEGFNTIGIYDSDIAGSFSELKTNATLAIKSFDEINPAFFEGGLREGQEPIIENLW